MQQSTVVGGIVGGVLGGLGGYFLGRFVERKEKSIDRGLATEFLGIMGTIAGGVAAAAVATMMSQSSSSTTTSTTALPPVAVGPGVTPVATQPSQTAAVT